MNSTFLFLLALFGAVYGHPWIHHKDSGPIITEFLKSAKPIFNSRDATKIGAFFDDSFQFKGCIGTYTKETMVQTIVTRPTNSTIDLVSLVSSKWIAQGQIEYIVDVSYIVKHSIMATFVYSTEKDALLSGSIEECPVKRLY